MIAALLLAIAQTGAAGAITGRVVDGASGKPMAGAVVAFGGTSLVGLSANAQPPRVLTGADGRFEFRHLETGIFSVTATKGGYAEGEPGRRRPGADAPPIVLSAAEPAADVVVPLWRYSALAGTVLDDGGEPLVALMVRALVREPGRRQYQVAASTFTDDRGLYRFGGLNPGEYLVLASPPLLSATTTMLSETIGGGRSGNALIAAFAEDRGQTPGATIGDAVVATGHGRAIPGVRERGLDVYPTTFYPAATSPDQAVRVTLGLGEERAGLDIQIVAAPTARVSGVLLNDGAAVRAVDVRLVPAGAGSVPADVVAQTSVSDSIGAFVFAGVPAGRYTLRAMNAGAAGMAWVDWPLPVGDQDVDGLVISMRPALRVTAHVEFDGAAPPPVAGTGRFTSGVFLLEAVDAPLDSMSLAATMSDGVFSLVGFPPGRYRVRVNDAPPGWMLKAALLGGVDVSETPFDLKSDIDNLTIVYTDHASGSPAASTARVRRSRFSSSRRTRWRGTTPERPFAASAPRAPIRAASSRSVRCRPATTSSSLCRTSRQRTGATRRRSTRSPGSRRGLRSPMERRSPSCSARRTLDDGDAGVACRARAGAGAA